MKKETENFFSDAEKKLIKKLNTPQKIQDFLDALPFNFEEKGETYHSPLNILRLRKAHCFEAAALAAAIIQINKIGRPLLLDLKVQDLKNDADHVIALFKINGLWGAISKTNHSVLRWRDPVYRNIHELAMSYFHEYFLPTGKKNMISYSLPFDISKKFGMDWITHSHDLDHVALALDKTKHRQIFNSKQKKYLRNASEIEIKASNLKEWPKK